MEKIAYNNGVEQELKIKENYNIDKTKNDLSILLLSLDLNNILEKVKNDYFKASKNLDINDINGHIKYFININKKVKNDLYLKYNNTTKEQIDFLYSNNINIITINRILFYNIYFWTDPSIYPKNNNIELLNTLINQKIIKNVDDLFKQYNTLFQDYPELIDKLNQNFRVSYGEYFIKYMRKILSGKYLKLEIFEDIKKESNINNIEKNILIELLKNDFKDELEKLK